MGSDHVKVLIADDQRLFAEALEAILSTDGRIEVVGRAADGGGAVELARQHLPDVVLMDIAMPVLDGFAATARIREQVPTARVIFLSGSDATQDISRAKAVGAVGYVTKDQIAGDLLQAILDTAAA